MRIFKGKRFAKFARKEGIDDAKLREAVREAEAGKVDADYGGGVIKQRIARPGEGKSGGYRSVILYRQGGQGVLRVWVSERRPGEHRQGARARV